MRVAASGTVRQVTPAPASWRRWSRSERGHLEEARGQRVASVAVARVTIVGAAIRGQGTRAARWLAHGRLTTRAECAESGVEGRAGHAVAVALRTTHGRARAAHTRQRSSTERPVVQVARLPHRLGVGRREAAQRRIPLTIRSNVTRLTSTTWGVGQRIAARCAHEAPSGQIRNGAAGPPCTTLSTGPSCACGGAAGSAASVVIPVCGLRRRAAHHPSRPEGDDAPHSAFRIHDRRLPRPPCHCNQLALTSQPQRPRGVTCKCNLNAFTSQSLLLLVCSLKERIPHERQEH